MSTKRDRRDELPTAQDQIEAVRADTPDARLSIEGTRTASWALVGGDARQLAIARRLRDVGFGVRMYGMGDNIPDGIRHCQTVDEALLGATGLVLPMPATRDKETVWCPLAPGCLIRLEQIEARIGDMAGTYLFGGGLPEPFARRLRTRPAPLTVIDYMTREDVQIKNAHITAEGAVMMAMELTDVTLQAARVAILGYGRIGQSLARMMISLGARVTVFARREESLARAETEGCRTARLDGHTTGLFPLCHGYDIIFNTVPARLLGQDILTRMDSHTLILDLAPTPGVADPAVVRAIREGNSVRIVPAPSLPGRYAPTSAGHVLADCILSVYRPKEVTV